MLAVLLALLQPLFGPELALIDRLPLAEATEQVLRGKHHAPIVAVEKVPPWHPSLPGQAARDFLEAPVRLPGGCERRRFNAQFFRADSFDGRPADVPKDAVLLSSVRENWEVVVANGPGCPADGYVYVFPEVDRTVAIMALKRVDAVLEGRRRVAFACDDQTQTGMCEGNTAILRKLAGMKPENVRRRDDAIAVLFIDGMSTTYLLIDPRKPDRVGIQHHLPVAS
jgi:hypothetical protein